MMGLRSNVARKAERLFNEGRISIIEAHPKFMRTEVVGDSATYRQTHYADKTVSCTCPSHEEICSHIVASRKVVGKKYRPLNFQELNESVFGDDNIV
ncbi:MAG: hypothetical protein Q8J63_00690 [Candidatus Aquicultor sp.]|nr:hypothetical protein [Candidatus Aquicultor sp.]